MLQHLIAEGRIAQVVRERRIQVQPVADDVSRELHLVICRTSHTIEGQAVAAGSAAVAPPAGRGAAAAKPRLDVVIRNFINQGRLPGPRYTAAGPEITTVGGLGDSSPSHIPHEGLNLGIVA